MNILLQFAIPLAVTFVALVVIAALRRYFALDMVVLCAGILILTVALTIPGIRQMRQQNTDQEDAPTLIFGEEAEQTGSMALVLQYLLDGNYEQAKNLIEELRMKDGGDPITTLCAARLAFLEERWSDAALLYDKAKSLFPEEDEDFPNDERKAAWALHSSLSRGEAAMIAHLSASGLSPEEYGLPEAREPDDVDLEKLTERIGKRNRELLDELSERTGDDDILLDAARHSSVLTTALRLYLGYEEYDQAAVHDSVEDLDTLMSDFPGLSEIGAIRIARLKGYVLLEDYKQLAEGLRAYAPGEEILIVSELYLAGILSERDFSDAYTEITDPILEVVVEQCEDVLENGMEGTDEATREAYAQKVASLPDPDGISVSSALRRDLHQAAQDSPELRSKSYLQLAKLEQSAGNTEAADAYITQALGSASLSDDFGYAAPMEDLMSIIGGSGSTEDVKNIAEYVEQAVNNSMPLDISAQMLHQTGDAAFEAPGDLPPEEELPTFSEHMTNTVSMQTAVINIGMIDKNSFPTVHARIQVNSSRISGPEDLLHNLEVYDCNSPIADFSVEKLEFKTSRIILLCDVSGSMSGNVDSLKNAIIQFSGEMNADEQISVIGFDDNIRFDHAFTSSSAAVASYAEDMGSFGGTQMYDALKYALDKFPEDVYSSNIVILLTDGEDNDAATEATIRTELAALASSNSATVYTLGLGSSVNTDYLSLIADACNGSFLHISDDESLSVFYDFIHRQLASQYILTYDAVNTTLNQRTLQLSVEGELGRAEKTYYLVEPEYGGESPEGYDPYLATDAELVVHGLRQKFLYRSSRDQTVDLIGEGFDSGDTVTARIVGNVEYIVDATYVDENTYSLCIPSNVATGTYTLRLSIRGESFTIANDLTIAARGNERTYRYGSYEFTALNAYEDDSTGETVLAGNVTMNGWLRFKGEVRIEGEYREDYSSHVTVIDNYGCYVPYQVNNSTGLARTLAEKGAALSFFPLGSFEIYTDPYSPSGYASFPVDPIDRLPYLNVFYLNLKNFSVSLYPDCLRIDNVGMQFRLPFQSQLLRNFPDEAEILNKSGALELGALVNATQLGMTGKVEYTTREKTDFSLVSLPVRLSGFSVQLDTLKNDYDLQGSIKFKAFLNMDSASAGLKIKDGWFDELSLKVGFDTPITLMTAPVPVSLSEFGYALGGFSVMKEGDFLKTLLNTEIRCMFEMNIADVGSLLPGLTKLITTEKELAAVTLSDCELALTLGQFRMKFSADATLFTILPIGKCEIEAGAFDYKNTLLGLDTKEYGLRTKLQLGETWKATNCEVQMQGSSETTIGFPYTGLWLEGDLGFDVGWWILRADWDVAGDLLIGMHINSHDQLQFSIIVRGTNSRGEYSGFQLFIVPGTKMEVHKY